MMILHDVYTRRRSIEIRFANDYCYECMWDMRDNGRERERMEEKMRARKRAREEDRMIRMEVFIIRKNLIKINVFTKLLTMYSLY